MHSRVRPQVHRAADRSRAQPPSPIAVKPITGVPTGGLQRKCPCGGGCPRCAPGGFAPLAIGERNDAAELEAQAWADSWMQAGHAAPPGNGDARTTGSADRPRYPALLSAAPGLREALRSIGHPLDTGLRDDFEPALQRDLSTVRVHHDAAAAAAARGVDAAAFAAGRDIVFGAGQWAPGSPAGQRLLAHELAHLAQPQGAGPVLRRAGTAAAVSEPVAPDVVPFPDEDELEERFSGLWWETLKTSWRLLDRDLAASQQLLVGLRSLDPSGLRMAEPSDTEAPEGLDWLQQTIDDILHFQSQWADATEVRRDDVEALYRQAAQALLVIEEKRPPLEQAAGLDDPLLAAYARVFPRDPLPQSLALAHRTRLAIKLSETKIDESVRDAAMAAIGDPATWAMLVASILVYVAAWLIPSGVTQLAAAGLTLYLLLMFVENDLIGFAVAWFTFMQHCDSATTEGELRQAGTEFIRASGGPVLDVMLMAMFWLGGKALGPKLAAHETALKAAKPPPEPPPRSPASNLRTLILEDGTMLVDIETGTNLARFDAQGRPIWINGERLLQEMRLGTLPPEQLPAPPQPHGLLPGGEGPSGGPTPTGAPGAPLAPTAARAAPSPAPTTPTPAAAEQPIGSLSPQAMSPETSVPAEGTATIGPVDAAVQSLLTEVASPELPVPAEAPAAAVATPAQAVTAGEPAVASSGGGKSGGGKSRGGSGLRGTWTPPPGTSSTAGPTPSSTTPRRSGPSTMGSPSPQALSENLALHQHTAEKVQPAAEPAALSAATQLSDAAASSRLQAIVGPGGDEPKRGFTPDEALDLFREAYPTQLRIVLNPNPELNPGDHANVVFLTLNETEQVVIVNAPPEMLKMTVAHEAMHIDDFARGRINAHANYDVPGTVDDAAVLRLGALVNPDVPDWDLVNSSFLEIVNYLRDAIRWVDFPSELELSSPYDQIMRYAGRIEGHLQSRRRDAAMSDEQFAQYLQGLQQQLRGAWAGAGVEEMFLQLQRWNRGYYVLRRSLPDLPAFGQMLGDWLPQDLRPRQAGPGNRD